MADNIPLIVEVQTKGVKQAATDLQALEKAASSAEKSTGGMSSGVNAVNAQLAAMGAKAKNAGSAFRDLDPAARKLSDIANEANKASVGTGRLRDELGRFIKNTDGIDKASDSLGELAKQADGAKSASKSLNSTFSELGGKIAGLFAGFSIAQFAGKLISVQREFDVLNSAMITITGSSAKAENEFLWIKSFAEETPFSLTEVTQAFIKLKTLGLDATKESLTSYGNTASAMGKSLDQMIEAVADASTGEFERLKEFGIKAKNDGDDISLTFQGVTKTIKNSAEEITQYLTAIGNNNFASAMAERAKTLDGAISNLGDSWDELFSTINQNNAGGLIFDSVKLATGAIKDMISLLNAMSGATSDAARETGAFTTAQNGLKTVFETVAILGMNVKYVLVQIGNEIGGLAAQASQLIQLNLSGAAAIGKMMKEDAAAARAELDRSEQKIFNRNKFNNDLGSLSAGLPKDPVKKPATGGGGGKAKGGRSAVEKISEEAKAYQDAMKGLATITSNAQKSTLELSAAQSALYDLMQSPGWATMPEAWKQTALAQFESARAAEMQAEKFKEHAKAMEEGKRVMESMRTPEEALAAEIVNLNRLLDEGAISWDVYARAVFAAQDKLDGTKEKVKETTDEMDEFAKSAAKNIQSSLADFLFDPFDKGLKGMAEAFGKMLQRMIAEAAAAQIAKYLFGDMKGGKVEGVVGPLLSAFSSWAMSANGNAFDNGQVQKFASGGVFGNGRILNKPTMFALGGTMGIAGEAGPEGALPLKRMRNGKLGVHMSGGKAMTINQTINAGAGTDKAEVKRAAASGARVALGVMSGARRYG